MKATTTQKEQKQPKNITNKTRTTQKRATKKNKEKTRTT